MAKKDSYIINKWLDKTLEYWRGRNSTYEYFWFHYLFNELYAKNTSFKQKWDSTPKMSANAPHYFTPYKSTFFEKIDDDKTELINKVQSPVFKLTHKYDLKREKKNTVIDHLINGKISMTQIKILVAWQGSFQKNVAVGDYLSVKTLTNFLYERNFEVDCASYKNFDGLKGKRILLDEVNPHYYDVLLFCGSLILKNHKNLNQLFETYNHVYKIGIGVGLLPKGHFNYYNPFDFLISKEYVNYENMAIIASKPARLYENKSTQEHNTLDVMLRNTQGEYGVENRAPNEDSSHLMRIARELIRMGCTIYAKLISLSLKKGSIRRESLRHLHALLLVFECKK